MMGDRAENWGAIAGAGAALGWLVFTGCASHGRLPAMMVEGQPSPPSSREASGAQAPAPCTVDDVIRVPPPPGLHGQPPSGPAYHHRVAPGRVVEALSDAVQVSVSTGSSMGCAVTRGGQVKCWPLSDTIHASGAGYTKLRRRAEPISKLARATAVALGASRGCALLEGGEVACWPTGTSYGPTLPQRIEGLHDARAIALSDRMACAVTARRTLACWRSWAMSHSDFPGWSSERAVEHVSLRDVRALALYDESVCVLQGGGAVSCLSASGTAPPPQAVTPPPSAVPEPVMKPAFIGAHQVVMADNTKCVITRERGVACWGNPQLLGGGESLANTGFVEEPRQVPGLTGVASLSAGGSSVCALLVDGTARCWGRNETGGLGDGTLDYRSAPTPVCNARGILQLAPGVASCALFSDGAVRCWGDLEAVEYD